MYPEWLQMKVSFSRVFFRPGWIHCFQPFCCILAFFWILAWPWLFAAIAHSRFSRANLMQTEETAELCTCCASTMTQPLDALTWVV